jgi:acyl-coenzyme A thioesterase PaaI-like protein
MKAEDDFSGSERGKFNDPDALSSIMAAIQQRLGDRMGDFLIPPPVFVTMQGEFLSFDADEGLLETRFPVLRDYLNPYGSLQGGMIAASVDNTFGPLSMLLAPPNVTRRLQLKYSQPVTPDLCYITVKARLLDRQGRWLTFSAEVRAPDGALLARAQAVHWVLEEPGTAA